MSNPLWKYSDPDWRAKYDLGLVKLDHGEMINDFKKWASVKDYYFVQNRETGVISWGLSSKRGNQTYAKNKKTKFDRIQKALNERTYDFPIRKSGFRSGTFRQTHILFLTFTIDQKAYTIEEAWKSMTSMLNNFRAWLSKRYGEGYASFTVKEANEVGYPAPHMVLILPEPIIVYRFLGANGRYKWILQDRKQYDHFHIEWAKLSRGSFIDITGVVKGDTGHGTVGYYLAKYMGKTVDLNNPIAVNTHAWQKFFNLRDPVPDTFLDALEIDHAPTLSRLDPYYNELKLLKKTIAQFDRYLTQMSPFFKGYDRAVNHIQYLRNQFAYRMSIIPPPLWVFLDCFRVTNRQQMQELYDLVLVYQSMNRSLGDQ